MNIGIFSGSFNPIHVGHLILANYIVEFTEIEEVWFLVSPRNPLKSERELLDENIRFEMTEIALEKYSKLKASDFEFALTRPSYTINTLNTLQKTYTEHQFSLIIGADNWNLFGNWKDNDKILENCKLKIYPRLGSHIIIPDKLKHRIEALDSPIIDVSSTFIRENIARGKDVRAFLQDDVYEYILKNKLYK